MGWVSHPTSAKEQIKGKNTKSLFVFNLVGTIEKQTQMVNALSYGQKQKENKSEIDIFFRPFGNWWELKHKDH